MGVETGCRTFGSADDDFSAPGFLATAVSCVLSELLPGCRGDSRAHLRPRWWAELGEILVLFECFNPACKRPFHNLGEGKLFRVERRGLPARRCLEEPVKRVERVIEHFWLCGRCCSRWTLTARHPLAENPPLLQNPGPKASAHRRSPEGGTDIQMVKSG